MLRNDMWNCWQSGRPNVQSLYPTPNIFVIHIFQEYRQHHDSPQRGLQKKENLNEVSPEFSTPPQYFHGPPSTSENEASVWIIDHLFLIYSTVYYN